MSPRSLAVATLLCACLPSACRDASSSSSGSSAGPALVPSTLGTSGCVGPNQVFNAPQTPVEVVLATAVLGPDSQLTAAQGAELLYVTAQDATVFALDVSGASAVETQLVTAGTVAALTGGAGVAGTPRLSGIAVLDATHLVLVEHASHALITCDRVSADTLAFYAGQPSDSAGFADGLATGTNGVARFAFDAPTGLVTTGESVPSVLVADSGNHAVRLVAFDSGSGLRFVSTLAGSGSAGFADGSLSSALFDTPTGLTLSCTQQVIVSERGENGHGQRLRALQVTSPNPFGGWFGVVSTLAGDGTADSTAGNGTQAEVSTPLAPYRTAQGDLYWVDGGTGVLRRRQSSGACDCPLAVDCATAVGAPSFPAGHAFSLTQTSSGVLYVLDGTAGKLWRVTP